MPHRHRSHILEDLSKTALQEALPESWVVHSYTNDYGIDVQIEIFSNDGLTTGLRFYGQIKATDHLQQEDTLSLDRPHFEYWSSHTDPVALFRFYAKTKTFYWCWMHEVNWLMKNNSKTVDVVSELKLWKKDSSPNDIESYLSVRRNVLFSPLSPPFIINVEHAEGEAASLVWATKLSEKITSECFRIIPRSASPGSFLVSINKNKISITHCGLPGLIYHNVKNLKDHQIVNYSILGIFLCACKYERLIFARALVSMALETLYETTDSNNVSHFFNALVFALGPKSASDAISPILYKEDLNNKWIIFILSCAMTSLHNGETYSWILLLKEWIKNPPVKNNIGTFYYNLGNALSSKGKYKEAYDAFNSALNADSIYNKRSYFWEEWGAINFELGKFDDALKCYDKAISLNDIAETHWKRGDVLFHLGQYAKAYDEFQSSLLQLSDKNYNYNYVKVLLSMCDEIKSVWNIEYQTISKINYDEHAKLALLSSRMSKNEVIEYIKPFMLKNAIDGHFNFNVGIKLTELGYYDMALYRFLSCSLINKWDTEAWCNSIVCALNIDNIYFAAQIMEIAYSFVGIKLTHRLLSIAPECVLVNQESSVNFIDAVIKLGGVLEKNIKYRNDIIIRMYDDNKNS